MPALFSTSPLLVLGTHNKKKRQELAELLEPLGFRLQTLDDFADALEVEETGDSFAANAQLKASQQAVHLGQWVLGEDSGLMVDALDGAPGIYSARFSGPEADDERNNRYLLEKLDGVPAERRTAQYVCHMSLADPHGAIRAESEGYCRGQILASGQGSGGFGYDPLFQLREYHRTFGQLGSAVKAVISHRARATRQIVPELVKLVAAGEWR